MSRAPSPPKRRKSAAPPANLYRHGMARIGIAAPRIAPANPAANVAAITALAAEADKRRAALCLFPELTISAYAIDDLLLQDALLESVKAAITRLAEKTRALLPVLIVGAPLAVGHTLYNCAVVLHRGRVSASCSGRRPARCRSSTRCIASAVRARR